MKKFLVLLCILGLCFLQIPSSFGFEKEKVFVEAGYSNIQESVDDTVPLSFGYTQTYSNEDFTDVDFLNGRLGLEAENMRLSQETVVLGYKNADIFQPYLIIGNAGLKFDQRLTGRLEWGEKENYLGDTSGSWKDGVSGNIFSLGFKDTQEVVFGLGLRGLIGKSDSGYILAYDISRIGFSAEHSGKVCIGDLSTALTTEVDYAQWVASLVLGKQFEFKDEAGNPNKHIKTLTPSVGLRWSDVTANLDTTASIKPYGDTKVSIGSEQNLKGELLSFTAGIKAEINDNWSASVNGVVGDEKGVMVKVGYSF